MGVCLLVRWWLLCGGWCFVFSFGFVAAGCAVVC